MNRPAHVPENAIYNEQDKQWNLGDKNQDGKEVGQWKAWHEQGHLCCITEYGDGTPPFAYQRIHPDGTLAQQGNWYGGNKFLGTIRFVKSEQPTPEYYPTGGADEAENVWIAEFDYPEEGIYVAQRYFDRNNHLVSSDGDLLPERPAAVSERAHFVKQAYSNTSWVMGTVDTRIGKYIGDYCEWDLGGTVVVKRLYSEAGDVLENHEYSNGKPFVSKVYDNDNLEQTFYYRDQEPGTVKEKIYYRNKQKDRTMVYFDVSGKQLYSVRSEEVAEGHGRRYYNDELVCEGIQNGDVEEAQANVTYYYQGGAKFIDFTPNGDRTGYWQMYDKEGKELQRLDVLDNDDYYRLKRWDVFMLSWRDYDEKREANDWDAVAANFERYRKKIVVATKQQTMEVPAVLQAELDKVDWEKVETAMGGQANLPVAINGFLAEDEDVVKMSEGQIWMEIEHQGSLYESTYKVAAILARMLPHYHHLPAVEKRLGGFVFQVLSNYYIVHNQELYAELKEAMAPSLPLIMKWAASNDPEFARWPQYMLVHAGNEAAEQLLLQEWQNTGHTPAKRGYALFSWSAYYILRQQLQKAVPVFAAAFATETSPFLRFIMATQLIEATREAAQENWLAEVLKVLVDSTAIDDDYGYLAAYLGDNDPQDYCLITLQYAKPEILLNNIEPVIDALPREGLYKQIFLLRTIFSVLFNEEGALQTITPLKKKALLEASAIVVKNPGFINLKEVFDQFGLPFDGYELGQLAQGVSK